VLPNATPTAMVISGNFRSWLEFIEKRDSPAADAEIRLLAKDIRGELERVAPAIFQSPPATLHEQLAPSFDPPKVEPEYVVQP